MKTASPALVALLNSGKQLLTCDLYKITLTNGTNIYLTSADIPIKYNGNTYKTRPLISRGDLTFETGISVDSLEITLSPKSTDLIGSISILQACRNGTFDGATLQLDKAFFTDWKQTPEVLDKLFLGRMDIEEISSSEVKIEVKSMTELLNVPVPKNIYQPVCPWLLYDLNTCKANKASFSVDGIINSGTISTLNTNLNQTSGYFDQGVILFTSGKNINIKRTVKSYNSGQIILSNPLQYAPTNGDTFTISRGCARTMDDCKNKFNKLSSFAGYPFIPQPDKIY